MNDQVQPLDQKGVLRRTARLTRDALSHEARAEWSSTIMSKLFELPTLQQANEIFTYVSVRSEVRTRDLIELLWQRGQTVLVPMLLSDELAMCRITDWNDIRIDAHGRCTPTNPDQAYTGEPSINLVPGLVFSEDGHRLGSGYGHYDRFIVKHPTTIHIGLAFELQVRPTLPAEPHDQQLDLIVTQDRVIEINDGLSEVQS